MNEEQKAQARRLWERKDVRALYRHGPKSSVGHESVPNLADETGAVEGVLHRVLEKLVGEPVEVRAIGEGVWQTECANTPKSFRMGSTRIDAIVASLLALESPR